jgi:enamine deaminase RidA (YjgF/YER057c/UK114 family)
MTAEIKYSNPPSLPTPVGYSQIVEARAGRLIFIAGQVPVDAKGELVGPGDFEAQAGQAFDNLGNALKSVGCTPRDLVKVTVFMRDMNNLLAYRAARVKFFGSTTPAAAPAVTLVEVSRLYDSKIMLEIEAIAAA